MKINNIITGINTSKRFENRVASIIKTELELKKLPIPYEVLLHGFGIGKISHGHYEYCLSIDFDELELEITKLTTNSSEYDTYTFYELNNTLSNWMKDRLLSLLEDRVDRLAEKWNEFLDEMDEDERMQYPH